MCPGPLANHNFVYSHGIYQPEEYNVSFLYATRIWRLHEGKLLCAQRVIARDVREPENMTTSEHGPGSKLGYSDSDPGLRIPISVPMPVPVPERSRVPPPIRPPDRPRSSVLDRSASPLSLSPVRRFGVVALAWQARATIYPRDLACGRLALHRQRSVSNADADPHRPRSLVFGVGVERGIEQVVPRHFQLLRSPMSYGEAR